MRRDGGVEGAASVGAVAVKGGGVMPRRLGVAGATAVRVGIGLAAWLVAGSAVAAPPVVQQVTATGRMKGDRFGWSTAIDGDVAVVGAPGRTTGPFPGAGVVTTLRRIDDAWTVVQTLDEAGTASVNRQYGHRVAVAGGLMAIGAPSYGASGGVYLYHDADGTWTYDGLIYDQVPMSGERLGVAVAISGATALAGTTSDGLPVMPGDTAIGRVRVFDYSSGWMEAANIVPVDSETGDRFGYAVALDGDTALVGAPGKDANYGVAYIFGRTEKGWTQVVKLAASDRQPGDFFGSAVALAGDAALIGSYNAMGSVGEAYVFERQGEAWVQTQILMSPAPVVGELFGAQVGLSGDYAMVTGYGFESVPNFGSRGSGYLYGRVATGYSLLTALRVDDGVTGDLLGIGGALAGGVALLGAPYDDSVTQPAYDPGSGYGSAYVFRLNQAVGELCTADEDCAAGAVCCAGLCAAECEGEPTSSGEEGSDSSSGGGETTASSGEESSGGSAPAPELEPLSEGCGCLAGAGLPARAGVWVLVVLLLRRRRRWRAL